MELGWLTVLIGNNGVGKSSLIEALETFRDVVLDGVDAAFRRWRGFEHVQNQARVRRLLRPPGRRQAYAHPLRFRFDWGLQGTRLTGHQAITQGPGGNELFIQEERLLQRRPDRKETWNRDDTGAVHFVGTRPDQLGPDCARMPKLADGQSMLRQFAWESFERWQFLMLNPDHMGQPTPQQRAASTVRLARDGANVAEYLSEIRRADLDALDGILEALRYVLPYASDLQPVLTSELERAYYLRMKEESYEVPGWLLSTGTLRIVALLALLRHPKPPPLLVVEEIENGLDPRSVQLVLREIGHAAESGRVQVIVTTHSPYLLDLTALENLVLCERVEGEPRFFRPSTFEELQAWQQQFTPGKLYTMGLLASERRGKKP